MSDILNCLKKIQGAVLGFHNIILNHHTRHEAGGGDEIETEAGVHHTTHENDGADEVNVAGLSGELADVQKTKAHTLGSHSTKAHSELTEVLASQHHVKTVSSDIDHGGAGGLGDDDHEHYWNNTRGDTKISTHSGDSDAHHIAKISGIVFNLGLAAVGTKLAQALVPAALTISLVKIYADTAPTGAALIVDVNKNGTTIFTTQGNRPQIAIGGHADDSGTPNVVNLAVGDRLSVDIDQVGSTVAGGDDLLVVVVCP
jgi:hypothetical protein